MVDSPTHSPVLQEFQIIIEGVPKAKERPRVHTGRKRAYTPKETKDFELKVAMLALKHRKDARGSVIGGPCGVEIYVVYPSLRGQKPGSAKTSRPDVDNLSKSILDGLEGALYLDDSQVVTLYVHKRYAFKGEHAATLVVVRECTEC